ncbi:MAG TPA: thioredoxin family protein, partial [Bacillales bacterium]|nr:thioredoxin family protein [Bacillales bacterium]
ITLESLRLDIPALSCNINFAPNLAKEWEIESVPCLIFFRHGAVEGKVYAFHSVSFLYDFLKKKM